MADYSPMMKQYFEVKEKYPNTLLFFRLGDFYEMFFNDAKIASVSYTHLLRNCKYWETVDFTLRIMPICGIVYSVSL